MCPFMKLEDDGFLVECCHPVDKEEYEFLCAEKRRDDTLKEQTIRRYGPYRDWDGKYSNQHMKMDIRLGQNKIVLEDGAVACAISFSDHETCCFCDPLCDRIPCNSYKRGDGRNVQWFISKPAKTDKADSAYESKEVVAENKAGAELVLRDGTVLVAVEEYESCDRCYFKQWWCFDVSCKGSIFGNRKPVIFVENPKGECETETLEGCREKTNPKGE